MGSNLCDERFTTLHIRDLWAAEPRKFYLSLCSPRANNDKPLSRYEEYKKEFFEPCLQNEPLQKLFNEHVQSSIAFRKRKLNKNFFDDLGCTALFAGEIQKKKV